MLRYQLGRLRPATLETLSEKLNGAPLEVFDGVWHVPSVEEPERFGKRYWQCQIKR
ncbi:hypothetical protein [Vreelandella populi]|uniref:hypothetical protein n=1 Tax=Vreelandella populi TaxID=2498858 RepID=UPI00163BF8D1|nr:hypothetical protein [Halomonas populi]